MNHWSRIINQSDIKCWCMTGAYLVHSTDNSVGNVPDQSPKASRCEMPSFPEVSAPKVVFRDGRRNLGLMYCGESPPLRLIDGPRVMAS